MHHTRFDMSWASQSPQEKRFDEANIFVISKPMDYTITYYSESVQKQILDLPDTLAARYVLLTHRMVAIEPNLGEPHTRLKEIKHANT